MTGRRRLSPEERRQELLAAAEGLLLDGDEPSLERVAERAGCSRNLAYNYFPNLDALLDALREQQIARLSQAVVDRIPRPAPLGVWADAWIDLILDEAAERGPLFLALAQGDGSVPRGRAMALGTVAAIELRLRAEGVESDRARILGRLLSGVLLSGAVAVSVDGCDRDLVRVELRRAVEQLLP